MVGKSPDEDPLGQGWGRGEQNEFGVYEYYEYPEQRQATGPTWTEIVTHGDLIEVDFQQYYGLDLRDVWHRKTLRWYRIRIEGLLSEPSRLARTLRAADTDDDEEGDDE